MDFNHRMASRIIADLEKTKSNQVSLDQLETILRDQLKALDSTFPKELKTLLDNLIPQIHRLETLNYAANLNTEMEGQEDAGIRDSSFDKAISALKKFEAGQ